MAWAIVTMTAEGGGSFPSLSVMTNGGGVANGGKFLLVLQLSFNVVQGILEHNCVLIWEISKN
jgi:hypothetical protein